MAHLNWLVRVAVPVVVPRRSSISRVGKTYEIRRRSADLFDVGIDTTFVSVVPSEASRKAAQHGRFAPLALFARSSSFGSGVSGDSVSRKRGLQDRKGGVWG